MAFDEGTWKEQLRDRLQGWKERMARAGVKSVYAFLSAATLWPVARAAQQGDWAALVALGGVLGNIGSNLWANQIQYWKDEADGARRLEQAVENDEELRRALDTLLEKLETLSQAASVLDEEDKAWFQQTLRQELARLGSNIHLENTVAVIDSPGGQATGPRAIRTKNITNSFLNTGTILYTVYQTPPGQARLTEDNFRRILGEYLQWVSNAYKRARLYGLESLQAARGRPVRSLDEVFVPLSLRRFTPPLRDEIEALAREKGDDPWAIPKAYLELARKRRETGEEVALDNILRVHDRVAIIGGAGSGKSTLLKYMAYSLATHALEGTPLPFALPSDRETLIPLLIPLRYYREYLEAAKASPQRLVDRPRTGTLAGFIPWYLKHRSPALELSEDFFDRLLLGGGCLLMLDGLDEVVPREDRGKVREEVERLANDIYPGNIVLVTAREAGYRENAVFGDDFVRLDIQPLTEDRVEHLVRNWCQLLYAPHEVNDHVSDIMDAVRKINERYRRQNLPPLFDTPLMATMVVSVKWGETELPRERARLYEAAVRVILQSQYLPEDEARQELVNWGGPWEEQREWLSHLALEMHRGGEGSAVIPEEQLRAILHPMLGEKQVEQFIRAVRERGGLLEERAGLFQFVHLTFQEFLAARLLAKQRRDAWPDLSRYVADSWWREVFLLIYGFAKVDYAPYAEEFLEWLSDLSDMDDAT
ncbi:MAG: NACHT domain-containing protein, partial [Chloroflexi bacterium]|nr:NACHT domain-containing protein [Chloroflexota bacterium]